MYDPPRLGYHCRLVVDYGGPPKLGHGMVSPFIPIQFIIPLSFFVLRAIFLFRNTSGVGEETTHRDFVILDSFSSWQDTHQMERIAGSITSYLVLLEG